MLLHREQQPGDSVDIKLAVNHELGEPGAVIPDGIWRLVYLVFSGVQFAIFRSQFEEKGRNLLDEARHLIERYFADVFECEAAVSALAQLNESEAQPLHPLADSMNRISAISPLFNWAGTPPELVPNVRIGFMNQNKRMLLDSVFDWDDLAYVLAALTDILADLLEKGQSLAEAEQLDLSSPIITNTAPRRLSSHNCWLAPATT